jgi:hypothetical protein
VENDLLVGLSRAAAEGNWAVVEILNEHLRRHRESAAGNVVALDAERAKRERPR